MISIPKLQNGNTPERHEQREVTSSKRKSWSLHHRNAKIRDSVNTLCLSTIHINMSILGLSLSTYVKLSIIQA